LPPPRKVYVVQAYCNHLVKPLNGAKANAKSSEEFVNLPTLRAACRVFRGDARPEGTGLPKPLGRALT
jgi:hypothetical protein